MKTENVELQIGTALAEPQCTLPSDFVVRLVEHALRTPAAAASTRLHTLQEQRPDIGQKGLHGIYAGIARGFDGDPDAILEVLDEAPEPLSWHDAKKWAESVGGRLPTRKESALLFANVPELFKEEAYWCYEQYAGLESFAWVQYFASGTQFGYHKSLVLRARAVRRLPLE